MKTVIQEIIPYTFSFVVMFGIIATSMVHFHKLDKDIETIKKHSFVAKHNKTISFVGNIFLLIAIVVVFYLKFKIPLKSNFNYLKRSNSINIQRLLSVTQSLLGAITGFIGMSGSFAGFFTFFRYDITKTKRIILLIICLIPIILTAINLLICPYLGRWSVESDLLLKLGIQSFLSVFLINGATIILGKHIMTIGYDLTRKFVNFVIKKRSSVV